MALRRTDGSYTGNLEERTSFQLETHFKNEEKSINRSFRGARSYSCTMDKKNASAGLPVSIQTLLHSVQNLAKS